MLSTCTIRAVSAARCDGEITLHRKITGFKIFRSQPRTAQLYSMLYACVQNTHMRSATYSMHSAVSLGGLQILRIARH